MIVKNKFKLLLIAASLQFASHPALAETIKLTCNVLPSIQSVVGYTAYPRETVQLDVEVNQGYVSFDADGQNVSIFVTNRKLPSYLEVKDYSTPDKWDLYVKVENKNGSISTQTLKLDRATGNLVFSREAKIGVSTVTGTCQKSSVANKF